MILRVGRLVDGVFWGLSSLYKHRRINLGIKMLVLHGPIFQSVLLVNQNMISLL